MMLRHGYSLLFTLFLSLSLTGCLGGNGTSNADDDSGDRSSETADDPEASLEETSAFSVEAGPSVIFTDGGSDIELVGQVINPNGVAIAETYWRTFDGSFDRIEGTAVSSEADNSYSFTPERRLADAIYTYQFVAIDSQGRAAVDTVYVRVNAYPFTVGASINATSVAEGGSFEIVVTLDQPLAEDIDVEYVLEGVNATSGADFSDCGACRLQIPAGETTTTLTIETLSDEEEEQDENLVLSFPALEELFGEESSVELTIIEDFESRSIINFAQTEFTVTEKDGVIQLPLTVEEVALVAPNLDSVETELTDDILTDYNTDLIDSGDVAIAAFSPVVSVAYSGSATGGEDFEENLEVSVNDLGGENPHISITILDDVVSEAIERVTVTLSENENFRVGETNTVNIDIQSDDVQFMAAAKDSYCTIEDHVGVRCWGDFGNGKTATPSLGEVEQLQGAGDYYCAIHTLDNERYLDCWGNVPGGAVSRNDAPQQLLVLDNEWCERTDRAVTCHGPQVANYTSDLLIGGFDGRCIIGEGLECGRALISASLRELIPDADQFLYAMTTIDDGAPLTIGCVQDSSGISCDGIELPDFSNPIGFTVFNNGNNPGVCVLDETIEGNNLLCYDSNGELFRPFDNFEQPYKIVSDYDNNICIADINGVQCDVLQTFGSALLALNASPVAEISTGSLDVNNYFEGLDFCGLVGGDLFCSNPGFNEHFYYIYEGVAATLDVGASVPAVLTNSGAVNFFERYQGGLLQNTAEFSETLTTSTQIAAGGGFVCATISSGVECYDTQESGMVSFNTPETITQIDANRNDACALINGDIMCWNSRSQGEATSRFTDPTLNGAFIDFSMKDFSGCGVTDSNALICWGNMSEYFFEQQSFNVGDYVDVQVSNNRVCVQGSNGVECWYRGEPTSVQINSLDITDLEVSDRHTCILEHGKVRCWGDYLGVEDVQILL